MTPEQIENLRKLAAKRKVWVGWTDDVRALLAEWEERGKQVEAFQRIVPRVEGERDAMYEEVERLSEQLRLCTVPDGWETWRRNAEARLAQVVEAARELKRAGEQELLPQLLAASRLLGAYTKQEWDEACAALAAAQPKIQCKHIYRPHAEVTGGYGRTCLKCGALETQPKEES